MDRSEVEAIVRRELDPTARSLGISHWEITVRFDLREGDGQWQTEGRCRIYVDYDKALITLDPEAMDDEAHVLRTLRHECFHIVLAPFDVLHNALDPLVGKDDALAAVLESVRTHAVEQAVINLERMYKNMLDRPYSQQEDRKMAKKKVAVAPDKPKVPKKGPAVAPAGTPQGAGPRPVPAKVRAKAGK